MLPLPLTLPPPPLLPPLRQGLPILPEASGPYSVRSPPRDMLLSSLPDTGCSKQWSFTMQASVSWGGGRQLGWREYN